MMAISVISNNVVGKSITGDGSQIIAASYGGKFYLTVNNPDNSLAAIIEAGYHPDGTANSTKIIPKRDLSSEEKRTVAEFLFRGLVNPPTKELASLVQNRAKQEVLFCKESGLPINEECAEYLARQGVSLQGVKVKGRRRPN